MIPLSWYLIVGAALAASWFASGEWGARYEAAENSLRALHSAIAHTRLDVEEPVS